MARIRTLKPEFWADEKLAPLSPLTRLVFLGLISLADDAGRVLDNIRLIDAQLFPETRDSALTAVQKLAAIGRIRRGVTANGQRVIEIVNWARHQRISHPHLAAAFPEIVEPSTEASTDLSTAPARGIHRGKRGKSQVVEKPHDPQIPDSYQRPTTNDQRPTTNDLTSVPDDVEDVFEEAWLRYPKRPNNSKPKARRAWLARVHAGEQPAVMLAGVQSYASYVRREAIAPRFIKLASTFFGPDKPYLDDYGSATELVRITDPNGRPTAALLSSLGARPPADA